MHRFAVMYDVHSFAFRMDIPFRIEVEAATHDEAERIAKRQNPLAENIKVRWLGAVEMVAVR